MTPHCSNEVKDTSSSPVVIFAVEKQSDIIPDDGEAEPKSVVKPKLVVGRNTVMIYCLVFPANGHKDALVSSA